MQCKLFGPGGSPDQHFRNGLKVLFDLDDRAWGVIAGWFAKTKTFSPSDEVSSSDVVASSLTPDQFIQSSETLKFILEASSIYGLDVPDVQRDLMLLGYPKDRIDRLGGLLQTLRPVREAAYRRYMRTEHENSVLPTLEHIDAVCDVRPIFEDIVYPLPETQAVHHTKLLGFTHMVLMELVAEDSGGRTRRFAFQMTDDSLRDFETTLGRVREQLDILKAKTRGLTNE